MFDKKKRQHATADLPEQAMNDSLRAAQVIFQRHTGSQASLSSGSTGSVNQTSSRAKARKAGYGTGISRPGHQQAFRSSSSVPRSALSLAPSSGSSQQQLSRPVSPLASGSAHAAAAMAHSRESDRQQEELLALAVLPQVPKRALSSSKIAQDSARRNPSSGDFTGSHGGTREKLPVSRSQTAALSPSAASFILRRTVSQASSASQSQSEVRQPPLQPASTPSSTNTVPTVDRERLKKLEVRTLAGRIPPPDIYFETKSDDVELEQESAGSDKDTGSFSQQLSSSSNGSSSSALSIALDGSSYLADEGDLDLEEQESQSDTGEYTGSENESPEQSLIHLPEHAFSVSSLPAESEDNSSSAAVRTNATYGVLNRLGHGNVTYQGTLPDLIPNHTRRTRIERFRTKLFGAKSRSDEASNKELSKSSVTADEDGRAVVTTNHNLRFRTTMRGRGRHSSNDFDNAYDGAPEQLDRTITNNYHAGVLTDSDDDDTDSIDDHEDDKKRKRRAARLKRRLKHTAVPYSHHLHHHETRHHMSRKGFNEDKPWKSHKDVGFVTPAERKRYEGMWVSNRCLYLELLPWWSSVISGQSAPPVSLPEDGLILSLVVKDIWARSNLPNDLLRQIYEKVDTRGDGTLDRKSFIVGMWLVDQCLYGRKLPKKISQQVWDSVDRYVVNVLNSTAMKHMGKSKKKLMKQEIKNIKKDIKNVHL
ncbi:hypothetical protein HG536_0F01660 [Torulaspora globosa]|uniref:EH domain-containing protein n=1 Tax=Torulaspora globosa TaxID=48254 RepID=A0A7G3ZK05_9SACH|nr:uncharacterized protein HG536_0F01660 [Torulaspora globosa]QLL33841.1 hypothetical protein HG536_0F01660 [Torulaspora globosa]